MSKLLSILINSLRPNDSWLAPMRAADPTDRWKYYAVRFGFVFLLIGLAIIFGFAPNNKLW